MAKTRKVVVGGRHPVADRWLKILFAEGRLDRMKAEESVRWVYRMAGQVEPRQWLWLDTLVEAANCVALVLTASRLSESAALEEYWRRSKRGMGAATMFKGLPELGEPWRIDSEDCAARRLWKAVRPGGGPLPIDAETERIRAEVGTGVVERLSVPASKAGFKRGSQPLAGMLLKSVEHELWVENRSGWRGTIGDLCWWSWYPHSELAVVDLWRERGAEVDAGAADALMAVANYTWMWWPFERGAILCERTGLTVGGLT